MKLLLPMVLLLSLVAPAKADGSCEMLADFYLEYVKPYSDQTKSGFGGGYFVGYVLGFSAGDDDRFIDIPSDVHFEKQVHVVGKWIQAHPEKWNLRKNQCVYDALRENWPAKGW